MALTIRVRGRELPVGAAAATGLRLLHPSIAAAVLRDYASLRRGIRDSRKHLDATIGWLCRAQDNAGSHGVSAGYALREGWQPPYPETTGYIIPTFYDYAQLTGREEYIARARKMADWEIRVQLPSGAVRAGFWQNDDNQPPAVFNTGQVILGFCRIFAETREDRYLAAAMRAGEWLLRVQAPDGSLRGQTHIVDSLVHTYDVRTAWSLLELSILTGEQRFTDAARLNLEWALAQQSENGWFANNSFFAGEQPYTHTIAYVMEGLFESWRLLRHPRYLAAVQKTAEKLLRLFELQRTLSGEFDSNWKTTKNYSCLTGDAQTAGVWLRLFDSGGDVRFLNGALKLNDLVKQTQALRALHPGVRGGIKGSQPINGGYTPWTYPNWAAKFFADSLIHEIRPVTAFEEKVRPRAAVPSHGRVSRG